MKRIPSLSTLVLLLSTLIAPVAWAAHHFTPPPVPQPPILGARVVDMASPELEKLGLEHGVRIIDVMPGGPAARAGLEAGDILVSMHGKSAYSVERVAWLLRQVRAGESVSVEYRRGTENRSADLLMGGYAEAPWTDPVPVQEPSRAYLGVMLQSLDPGLREAFGVPGDQGVLVSQVQTGSPADKAGLKSADVILRLDDKPIRSATDLRREIAFLQPGDKPVLRIMRSGESSDLSVTLEARPWNADQALHWQHPGEAEDLRDLLPPPEYWRRLMDRMMQSLQESWGEYREDWPKPEKDYQ